MARTRLLWIDFETFCEVPISYGAYRYAEAVEVMLVAFAFGDDEPRVLDLTNSAEQSSQLFSEVCAALTDPAVFKIAHNANFDRVQASKMLGVNGFLDASQWGCTLTQALAHSLPANLAKLGEVLGLPERLTKMPEGKKLVNLFCKPLPATRKLRRATRETHPDQWTQFMDYAGRDISAMRECAHRMPAVNYCAVPESLARTESTYREVILYQMDQIINDRGVALDLDFIDRALIELSADAERVDSEVNQMTGGTVESARQRDAMLMHLADDHGVYLPDLTSSTVEKALDDPELAPVARLLLESRQNASKSSTAKFAKLRQYACADGRFRGGLQFCGAGRTRRWAGRGPQPQNFPRPKPGTRVADVEATIAATKAGALQYIGDVPHRLADALRGVFVAAPGHSLHAADLSNIEGRIQAWCGGEDWKLEAFRNYDCGTGPDLYKVAYARAFSLPVDQITKSERQIGKVMELALGYEGGVSAFVSMATVYGLDLGQLAIKVRETVSVEDWEASANFRQWMVVEKKRPTYGLAPDVYIACNVLKTAWRAAHPGIKTLWSTLKASALETLLTGCDSVIVLKGNARLKLRLQNSYLQIELPSRRSLIYYQSEVHGDSITYMGVNSYTKQWCRLRTHGGKLFNNVVQALARDVLADNFLTSGSAFGVMTVHDEGICEVPDRAWPEESELSRRITKTVDWAPTLPLSASGFVAQRYRKDD